MPQKTEIPKRVLVVDDEPDIRARFTEALKGQSWDVKTCSDGATVAATVEEFNPTVVMLDLRMPKKDGLQVLKELRKTHPWTQVIIVTGHGDEEDAINCLNEGVFKYIRKPASVLNFPEICENARNNIPAGVWAFHNWYRALPDPDRVLFQTASGRKISAKQLMEEIQNQTQIGREFIRQVMELAIELIGQRLA